MKNRDRLSKILGGQVPEVIIVVSGGLVIDVFGAGGYLVLDHDHLKEDGSDFDDLEMIPMTAAIGSTAALKEVKEAQRLVERNRKEMEK